MRSGRCMESWISRRSLMIGKESTEESRNEISRSPGAPNPPAKAMIRCFQPPKLSAKRSSHPFWSAAARCRFSHSQGSIYWRCQLSQIQCHPAKLLRKRSTVKMVHEDLHQRGAVKIGQTRYFTDDTDVSKALDGFAVLSILIANQNHAMHRQFGRVQSRQREQRVIDGPSTATRRENH